MANIGLRRFYFAPVMIPDGENVTEADVQAAAGLGYVLSDTGDGRTPYVIEGARRCQVTYNKADGQLYGDDQLAEQWALVLSADIEVEWAPRYTPDDFSRDGYRTEGLDGVLLGTEWQDDNTFSAADVFHLATENRTEVGFGFVQTRIINGAKSYRAIKFHKVVFSVESEESQTKEEQIEWDCPILRGHAMPALLYNPTTGAWEEQLREYMDFDDLDTAYTWLASTMQKDLTLWTSDAGFALNGVTLDPTFDNTKAAQTLACTVNAAKDCVITGASATNDLLWIDEGLTTADSGASLTKTTGSTPRYVLSLGTGGEEIPAADLPEGYSSGTVADIVVRYQNRLPVTAGEYYPTALYTITIRRTCLAPE